MVIHYYDDETMTELVSWLEAERDVTHHEFPLGMSTEAFLVQWHKGSVLSFGLSRCEPDFLEVNHSFWAMKENLIILLWVPEERYTEFVHNSLDLLGRSSTMTIQP
jgi:hypothetical protein